MSAGTWGPPARNMHPQSCSALDFWQMALSCALPQCWDAGVPTRLSFVPLISSKAASSHSELPPRAGHGFSLVSIAVAGVLQAQQSPLWH